MAKIWNCYGLFLSQLILLLTIAIRQSSALSIENEQTNKWIEGEAIVSNEIIRYQGFLGFGLWNGGILSTPKASQYRHWVRCSALHDSSFSVTFLVGRDPKDTVANKRIVQEMFTYKDIILFDTSETYGFAVTKKVFGFFDAGRSSLVSEN